MADGLNTNAKQTERLILLLANRTCELSFLATNLNAGDILIGLDTIDRIDRLGQTNISKTLHIFRQAIQFTTHY